MQRLQAVVPVVEQRQPVAAVDLDAEAAPELGRDLEAGRVDDAVDVVLAAVGDDARRRDALDALGLADVDERDVVRLKQARYSSLNVGRLHIWRYHGFSASAVSGSATVSSTRWRIWFIFRKSAISRICGPLLAGLRLVGALRAPSPTLRKMSVQPSSTRSSSTGWPDARAPKFSRRSRCQPGCSVVPPLRIGRLVAAPVDRRRRALEHVELLGVLRRRAARTGWRWRRCR